MTEPARSRRENGSVAARLLSVSVVRYLLAGGVSFLVDLGLLALFHSVFGWPVWLATGTAFLISFAFTYTLQRLFSFMATTPHGRALLRYTLLVGFNTLASVAIVSAVNASLVGWVGGKVIATAVTTAWNFFAYKYWVFAPARSTDTYAPERE